MVEHNERGRRVRAAVDVRGDFACGKGAVLVERVLDVNRSAGTGRAVGEDLLTRLHDLHGAMALAREHDARACDGAVVLAAEAAPHERDVHMKIGGLHIEGGGHAVLDETAALFACPYFQPAVRQRFHDRDVRLHEAVADARELIALLGKLEIGIFIHFVKLRSESGVVFFRRGIVVGIETKGVAVAHSALDRLIGVLAIEAVGNTVQVETLIALDIVVDNGGAVLFVCLLRIQHIGQRLVLDMDQLARGLGDLLRRRGDGCDRVADAAHLVADAAHDELVRQIAADSGMIRSVHTGDDSDNAGELFGLARVNALDDAVRDGAAEDLAVDHSLGMNIGRIEGGAGHLQCGVLTDLSFADGIIIICHDVSSFQPPHWAMGPALYTLSGLGSVSSFTSPAACFFMTSLACMMASMILV